MAIPLMTWGGLANDASLEKVSWDRLSQLPYISTANGMQDQPNSWHLGPFEWSLGASAARATTPAW